jgi:hypothetical protein
MRGGENPELIFARSNAGQPAADLLRWQAILFHPSGVWNTPTDGDTTKEEAVAALRARAASVRNGAAS